MGKENEMKEYTVNVPVVATLTITLEANNDKEAIRKALQAPVNLPPEFIEDSFDENFEDYIDVDIEWDMYEKIIEGNVFYAPINKPEIICVEECDE